MWINLILISNSPAPGSRLPILTDAQNATAWNGLTVSNGGLGPNGLPVGVEDQRSKIRTFNIAPTWTRILNPNTVFTFGGWVRQDQYNPYPSDNPFADLTTDLQSATEGQSRRLTNAGARASLSYVKGVHNIKQIGSTYEHTFLTERDTFGLVDPTVKRPLPEFRRARQHEPCADRSQRLPGRRGANQNPDFIPLLACYDLTRTAPLPASDGCLGATSGEYRYFSATPISRNSRFT